MRIYPFILIVFALVGCTKYPSYQKMDIYQPPNEIKHYENSLKNKTPNEVAKFVKDDFLQKLGDNKRVKIDDYLYFEDIYNKDNEVIFNYSLTLYFTEQEKSDQLKIVDFMRTSLINQACNLKTTRKSLNLGMVELHRYFYDYPQSMAFEFQISKEICENAGL